MVCKIGIKIEIQLFIQTRRSSRIFTPQTEFMNSVHVAIVTGGYTGEKVISLQTAVTFSRALESLPYRNTIVTIEKEAWYVEEDGQRLSINKDDFSFSDAQGNHVRFDVALIALHGSPGENGWLQGYLAMLGIPHTTGDTLNMALTFNKIATLDALERYGFHRAPNCIYRKGDSWSAAKFTLSFPVFVKPVEAGSSLGISKVGSIESMPAALEKAFAEDDEVLVEQAIVGTEVTCGVYRSGGTTKALPPTEIRSKNDFFDYRAKYHKESEEITPAEIAPEAIRRIQNEAMQIYDRLNCRGIARVDFMLSEGTPYVIEINTVPGMSAESIVPQQIEAAGMRLSAVLDELIQQALSAEKN